MISLCRARQRKSYKCAHNPGWQNAVNLLLKHCGRLGKEGRYKIVGVSQDHRGLAQVIWGESRVGITYIPGKFSNIFQLNTRVE